MLLNIEIPAAIDKTLTSFGRCSTPLIMVFLGMILYETGMGNMFKRIFLNSASCV
jgi:predicted permease